MSRLKPCPFCGKEPMQYVQTGLVGCMYAMCGVNPECFSVEDWNMRADGWINVDERLPEKYSWYLIVSSTKVTMAFYDGDTVNEDGGLWLVHNDNPDSDEWENVTHWMPLPEPPEEKS